MTERVIQLRVVVDGKVVAVEYVSGVHWYHKEFTDGRLGEFRLGNYPGAGVREQFTGFTDSKKAEIYDRDKCDLGGVTCVIEWHRGQWIVVSHDERLVSPLRDVIDSDSRDITVIGRHEDDHGTN